MDSLRLDKWLFAARFYRSRSLASEAVSGGKVFLDGKRVKPSHRIQAGNTLQVNRGRDKCTIIIHQLSDKRGSACVAQSLYEETEVSIEQRKASDSKDKMLSQPTPHPTRRPNKQERRHIIKFIRKT